MPQLHLTVDPETARELSRRAAEKGISLSRYLAELVRQEVPDRWPADYLEGVIGACAADPLAEPPDLPLDEVDLA